ncbi:hypothetical protein EDB87DRAFT_1650656 [Lactarius vividus]|nr:hypothetical protein EDB87DRAFT_1650656 [Lactarius vividus]
MLWWCSLECLVIDAVAAKLLWPQALRMRFAMITENHDENMTVTSALMRRCRPYRLSVSRLGLGDITSSHIRLPALLYLTLVSMVKPGIPSPSLQFPDTIGH